MLRRTWRRCRPAVVLLAAVWLAGCATYSAKFADLRPELAAGMYDDALATIEENSGDKDRLLYYLERGLVLHFADRWQESNEAFAAAERTADDLYTKSISEGALSLITSDNSISYRARPFEMAMVPYYKALNYIYLGDREAALVEGRRANLLLRKYVDATLNGLRDEDRSDLARIGNNAFMQYVSGMLYDWDGEINDAFTSYRNAAVAYQQNKTLLRLEIPPSLARDLERVGRRLGFGAELDHLRQTCPDVFTAAEIDAPPGAPAAAATWQPGHGEVVVFVELGYVPMKTQVRFDIPIFEGEAYNDPDYWSWQIWAGMGNMQAFVRGRKIEYWVTVAAPELQDEPGEIGGVLVDVVGQEIEVAGHKADNLLRAARVTFDAEKPTIFFKTILRGLTKYLATRGAENAGGKWAGLAANIFGSATETADTRSWLTLPEDIQLVRLHLPAGTYDLQVTPFDRRGRPLSPRTIAGVEVTAGEWTFLSRRLF